MPDKSLVNFYKQINEQLADINTKIKQNENFDSFYSNDFNSQDNFIIGGDEYYLYKKKEMIIYELNKRKIKIKEFIK